MELDTAKIYTQRFSARELDAKDKLWRILCDDFFQKFIPRNSVVIDIGAGNCEFINNIKASVKYAIDINDSVREYAQHDIKVIVADAVDMRVLNNDHVDVVFISNFFEHLKSKMQLVEALLEVHRICKIGGSVLVLQPNIKYAYRSYWDFFDHNIALSDKSMSEALTLVGFRVVEQYPRFLPFTTKSKYPKSTLLVKLYLKFPILWQLLGKQAFIVAVKEPGKSL